jgi:hypothetical protein
MVPALLPEGVVVKRPDPCYLALLDAAIPTNLLEGTKSLALASACMSYMSGEAYRQKQLAKPDDGPVVIGNSHAEVVAQEAFDAAIERHDASQAPYGGPFNGIAWDLLLNFLRQQVRDPAVMDVGARLWAKVL